MVLIIAAILFPFFFVYLFLIPSVIVRFILAVLFVTFCYVDMCDGKLARRLGCVYPSGSRMQPMVHQLVDVGVLLALVQLYYVPAYIATWCIMRECMVAYVQIMHQEADVFVLLYNRVTRVLQVVWMSLLIIMVPSVWLVYVRMALLGAVLCGTGIVVYHLIIAHLVIKKEPEEHDAHSE